MSMRLRRLFFILTAFYFVFIGGTAYYDLVPGVRFFHHAFVTLLLAVWLLGRIRSGQGLPVGSLNAPFYAIVLVWFISAAFSLYPRMAFENLWFPLTHTIIFFMLVDVIQQGRQKLLVETQLILAAMIVFISGIELASWYFGLGLLPGTSIGWAQTGVLPPVMRRVSLAMNISTLLAGYVAPLVTLTLAWALTTRPRGARLALLVLTGLLAVVLVLTFSRGGLLSLAVGISVLIAFQVIHFERFSALVSLRLIAGALIIGVIGALSLYMVYKVSTDRRSGDEGRVDMWVSALAMLRDETLVGVGPGLFGRAFRTYRDPAIARDKLASAHNAYLNTAAETGTLGVLVSLWLGVALAWGWWRRWRAATTSTERIRQEAALAALLGIGVHSLVDTFTITPIVLLILGLAAYCVTPSRSPLDPPLAAPRGRRLRAQVAAGVGLVIVVGYGLWFLIQVDPAYASYLNSLSGNLADRMDAARAAAERDPDLNLYDLQIAYLNGLQAESADQQTSEGAALTDQAVAAYQNALVLEPTWDTGWMNLAALYTRQGKSEAALDALNEALWINPLTVASLNRGEIAEEAQLLPRTPITTAYAQGITSQVRSGRLPLSDFWTATSLRTAALKQYINLEAPSVEVQYRIISTQFPDQVELLVPVEPETAADWWVVGQHALTVGNDPAAAQDAFTHAINLEPTSGDYYASRARAELTENPDQARRDLDLAMLLGTTYEYPGAVRAELAETPEEAYDLRVRALPLVSIGQEFAAVLYAGRISGFDLLPELRPPGPGRAAMQPWYTIAGQYEAEGRTADAIRVYRAIVNYAPDEAEAQSRLRQLASES